MIKKYDSCVTEYSLTREKNEWLLNLACLGFLCVTSLINEFSADPLFLKNLAPLEQKAAVGSVLAF